MRQAARDRLFEGAVIPAVPLVLRADRSFDERGQRGLIRYYLDAGVGGLAVAVHTTQFAIRSPQIGLYEPVLRVASEEMGAHEKKTGKTIIKIAGVCGEEAQAEKEAAISKAYGYDAALLSTGGLASYDENRLIDRARRISGVLPVVGFYLQPSAGGRVLSYHYWTRLCEIPGVIAIKAAPFNRYMTTDVVRAVALCGRAEEIALYTGNDDHIVADLLTAYRFRDANGVLREKRFVGGLLGHWAVWTKTAVDVFGMIKECLHGGFIPSEMLTLHAEVTDCNGAFFDAAHSYTGCIAGVHEVLRRQGLVKGIWCLDPDETLSEGQAEEIDRVYRMYPHLNDDRFVSENMKRWFG